MYQKVYQRIIGEYVFLYSPFGYYIDLDFCVDKSLYTKLTSS